MGLIGGMLLNEYGISDEILNETVEVQKSDRYPFHDIPDSGQNPGFEALHGPPSRWSSQRALVLTEESINQQFEQLYNQEPALQRLYHRSRDGKNWLDAKTYPYSVKILDGVTRAADQEVYLVLRFKSGRIEPLGLDVTDFKLYFSCDLKTAQSIGPGYSTQLLFKTLNSINGNTIDVSLSMYGKDRTQEQFMASDNGSVKYDRMKLFFTEMMQDNQSKGYTKFGYQIDVGTPWPSSSGYTELSLYNARTTKTNNFDYSDANYLLWVESPHAKSDYHELCPAFNRQLAERLKARVTSSLYVEIHQIAEDRLGGAVKEYLKKLWVELEGGTHFRVFGSKQNPADSFNWNISWNSYGQVNEIKTFRKWIKTESDLNPTVPFSYASGINRVQGTNWQQFMRDSVNKNIYKRGRSKCELSSTVTIDGDCLRYEHTQGIDMNWFLYSNSGPVPVDQTTKGYKHSWCYAYTVSGGHTYWDPPNTGVYSQVRKQEILSGGLAEWEKNETAESLKNFQNVAHSATLAAEQELKTFWSQIQTVNLKDVRKWLDNAKITIHESDQSKMSNLDKKTRQLLLSVTIAPADGIRITAEEAPPKPPARKSPEPTPTKSPEPTPTKSPEPTPTNSSNSPPADSTKPPLTDPSKSVEVKTGELKSAVTVAYPGKILPKMLTTIKLDIDPKDNNALRYRYLEVQFRAKTRGGQLFVPQQSGNTMNVDASVKSKTVKTSTQRQESLQSSIKSLRGMGYAVHLVGAKSDNGANMLTVGKHAGALGLKVSVTGLTNEPGQYEMVVVESHVDDRGDILERLESSFTVTVAAA